MQKIFSKEVLIILKKVLSISLGASSRNHKVKKTILGQTVSIERRGTDGDKGKAARLFSELDGKYDAFGIGGIDLYVYSGTNRYKIRETAAITKKAQVTPVVDGSGLKNTLEPKIVAELQQGKEVDFNDKTVLIVSAVDRYGMAKTFQKLGCQLIVGDLLFILGFPLTLKSLKPLEIIARIAAPLVVKLPVEMLYPTGAKQRSVKNKKRYHKQFCRADIIAGDFHLIKRYMARELKGKIIITNTVTPEDIELLREKKVKKLVTTTPSLEGRSFGTNVIEAVLVALSEKSPELISPEDYLNLLKKINFQPRIENLN